MTVSDSAKYQRALRERRRAQGLIKKDVWVLPDYAGVLSAVEKALQKPGALVHLHTQEGDIKPMSTPFWMTTDLCGALQRSSLTADGAATVELFNGVDPVINVTLNDFGDLSMQVTVAGDVIIAQAVLWSQSLVKDTAAFNEAVLRSEKMFDLANISLDQLADGDWVYVMYGSLRATSSLDDVIHEIQTLGENVIEATEAFRSYLN